MLTQPRMPTCTLLNKVLRVPLASQQCLPHERYQGTSVNRRQKPPGIKPGALGFPHKAHVPCGPGRRHPAVYFSSVSWQLVSTVAPLGKDSELLQMAGGQQEAELPPALQNACGPSWRHPPSQAGVRLPSKAGLAGTCCPVNTSAGCLHTDTAASSSSQSLQLSLQQ